MQHQLSPDKNVHVKEEVGPSHCALPLSPVKRYVWKGLLWFSPRKTALSNPSPSMTSKQRHPKSCRSQSSKQAYKRNRKEAKRFPSLSPQDYVESLMRNRGFQVEHHYIAFEEPDSLQLACHSTYLVNAAKNDPETLRSLLEVGLSPNSCNAHGDSLLNMVCRRNLLETVQVMVEFGARFDIVGANGMTALHEACWNSPPNFGLIELIVKHAGESCFNVKDKRGFLPLQYANIDDWDAWLRFLESRKELFWPIATVVPREQTRIIEPLSPKLAEVVAKGSVSLDDLWMFLDDDTEFLEEITESSYGDEEDDDDEKI